MSQYQRRHNQKYHSASVKETQDPFQSFLLEQTKV